MAVLAAVYNAFDMHIRAEYSYTYCCVYVLRNTNYYVIIIIAGIPFFMCSQRPRVITKGTSYVRKPFGQRIGWFSHFKGLRMGRRRKIIPQLNHFEVHFDEITEYVKYEYRTLGRRCTPVHDLSSRQYELGVNQSQYTLRISFEWIIRIFMIFTRNLRVNFSTGANNEQGWSRAYSIDIS